MGQGGSSEERDPPSQTPSNFDVTTIVKNDKNYVTTTTDFMSRRKLWRGATSIHIWALAVGAVISGEFFGFNLGYKFGGLGTYMVSLFVISVMYIGIGLILSELSSAIPFSGGAYAFSRATLGKFAGCYSGMAESLEYLATVGSIIWFLSIEICFILGVDDDLVPLCSVIIYLIILVLQCWGGVIMWSVTVLLTVISCLWLLVYFFGTIKDWDGGDNLDVRPGHPGSRWWSEGVEGFFAALAPAVWFYLAVEQVPLAAEECKNPKKNIPRGMMSAVATLVLLAWMTLLSVAFTPRGVGVAKKAAFPLSDGWNNIFGGDVSLELQHLCSILPLFTSAYCITFAYGRQIFAMSRAGYLPEFLSLTLPGRGTPAAALVVGAVITIVAQLVIHYGIEDPTPDSLLFSAAVICALVSYFMTALSYVIFVYRYGDDIERPFKAPLGYWWAGYVMIVSAIALVCSFIFVDNFLWGLVLCGGFFAIMMSYYLVWSRTRLRISPEEQFAMFCLYRSQVQHETHKMGLNPDLENKSTFQKFLDLFS